MPDYKATGDTADERETITLTLVDAKAFASALISPPTPNEAATAAARRYLKSRND